VEACHLADDLRANGTGGAGDHHLGSVDPLGEALVFEDDGRPPEQVFYVHVMDLAGVKIAVEPFVGAGDIFHAYPPGDTHVDDLAFAFRGDLIGGDADDDLLHLFLFNDAVEGLFRGIDHQAFDGFPVELGVVVDEAHEVIVEVVVLFDHRFGDLSHGAGAPDHDMGVRFGLAHQVTPQVGHNQAVSGEEHRRDKKLHDDDRSRDFKGRHEPHACQVDDEKSGRINKKRMEHPEGIGEVSLAEDAGVRLGEVAGADKEREGGYYLEGQLRHVGRQVHQVKPQEIGQNKDHGHHHHVSDQHDPPGQKNAVKEVFNPRSHMKKLWVCNNICSIKQRADKDNRVL